MTKRSKKQWAALAVIGIATAWPYPTFAKHRVPAKETRELVDIIASTKADIVVSQMRK